MWRRPQGLARRLWIWGKRLYLKSGGLLMSLRSEFLRLLKEDEEFRLAAVGLLGIVDVQSALRRLTEVVTRLAEGQVALMRSQTALLDALNSLTAAVQKMWEGQQELLSSQLRLLESLQRLVDDQQKLLEM